MQAKDIVGLYVPAELAVVQHPGRSFTCLFRRLEHKYDLTFQRPVIMQCLSQSGQYSHMAVVTAQVSPVCIDGPVFKLADLFYWQCVKISPEKYFFTGFLTFEYKGNTFSAYTSNNLVRLISRNLLPQPFGSVFFLSGCFGMLVQFSPELYKMTRIHYFLL